MAKWTLHRLWARYQLLVGISALHTNFADVCIIYGIYGLPVCPCDGSTKPLIFLWPSQVALLFPGQGSQYVKMMGNREGHASSEGDLGLSTATADYPSSKCICAKSCQGGISRFNSETLGVSFLMYYPPVSFLITRGRFTQTVE